MTTIKARFQLRTDGHFHMIDRSWADAGNAFLAAHDMMDHCLSDRGSLENELRALGASLLTRARTHCIVVSDVFTVIQYGLSKKLKSAPSLTQVFGCDDDDARWPSWAADLYREGECGVLNKVKELLAEDPKPFTDPLHNLFAKEEARLVYRRAGMQVFIQDVLGWIKLGFYLSLSRYKNLCYCGIYATHDFFHELLDSFIVFRNENRRGETRLDGYYVDVHFYKYVMVEVSINPDARTINFQKL